MNTLSPKPLMSDHQSSWVAFVGSHLTFSKYAVRLLQAEHPEIDFMRVTHLRGLSEAIALRGAPVLTVIEECLFVPFMNDVTGLAQFDSAGRLTLAYRDPLVAKELVSMSRAHCAMRDIGVLPLNAEIEVWLSMFNLLLCGEILYPRAVIDAEPLRADATLPSGAELTPREWEILEKLSEGQQNKVIATGLNLSEHTVKLHVHHVLKKLGVSNRTGAASWFANHGTMV